MPTKPRVTTELIDKIISTWDKKRIPLRGGLADGWHPGEFSRRQLRKGIVVEYEHTNDPYVACKIAMDHLVEDIKNEEEIPYYDRLEYIER